MRIELCVEALDELVPEILAASDTPGVSIAIGVDDEVVFAQGYGYADLATGRPMAADTVGPIGSDSKTYTAAAVMQLVERGLIGLDDPVNDHLDGWRIDNPWGAREITLRDLLTHRSGLGITFGYSDLKPPRPLGEHLRRVFAEGRSDVYGGALTPLWSTPVGMQYQYTNTGLAIVGYLVELLNPDRVPFHEWVRRHIFTPLGMTSSCFPPVQDSTYVPAGLLARRSTGYATLAGYQFPLPAVHVADYPSGTALSTPSDHARFVLATLGGGGPILRPDSAAQLISPQGTLGPDPLAAVGLVWNVFRYGEPDGYIGHGGEYFWGWSNFTRGWPGRRTALVVAANQWHLADGGTSDRPSHLAGRLVADVVTAWVNGRDPRPRRDTAAAQSYLAGLLVADRLGIRFGVPVTVSDAEIDRIAGGTIVRPGTRWNAEAFQEALRDVRATDGTVGAVFELVRRKAPEHTQAFLQHLLGVPRLSQQAAPLDDGG